MGWWLFFRVEFSQVKLVESPAIAHVGHILESIQRQKGAFQIDMKTQNKGPKKLQLKLQLQSWSLF